jgi:hypothetical protein
MKCPVTVWWALAGGPVPLAAQVVVRAATVALVETVLVRSFLFALSLLAFLISVSVSPRDEFSAA